MNFDKEQATCVAAELDAIAEKMESEIEKDMNGETEQTAETEFVEAPVEETVSDEKVEAFEKKARAYKSVNELKHDLRGLMRELGIGAREVIAAIRKNVPNKTLRILMKIGLGIAVFSIIGSKLGRLAIAIAAVILVFGTEEKESAK